MFPRFNSLERFKIHDRWVIITKSANRFGSTLRGLEVLSVLAFMVYRFFLLFRYLGCPSNFVRSITKKNGVQSSDKDKFF